MHALQVRQVTKTYAHGDAAMTALAGIDLDIRRGEVTLLMGPSGSGKTTLLSVMGCIMRPTSGAVYVLGDETTRLPEHQLPTIRRDRIGFVFQGFNLFPTLTVLQNVMLAFDVKRVAGGDARERATILLDAVGLAQKLHAYPANLSGGQKQRVAIARALAGDPPIVLGDEPTAALDSESGRRVMELLGTLAHRDNRAVVVVTHDGRILRYADRIVCIDDGRIVSDRDPRIDLEPES